MIESPLKLQFRKAVPSSGDGSRVLNTFSSYSFERNLLIPAAAFRFTAPAVDKNLRTQIRSGDEVQVIVKTAAGELPLATGIIDETDTHVTPGSVEYVLSGRDMLGQLVDNAAVDASDRIILIEKATLPTILDTLIANTRIPKRVKKSQVPNGALLFQTSPGETKINALQRMLEFTNCLVWCQPNGQLVLGKPDFTQKPKGILKLSSSSPADNNCLEGRSRRNVNQAIRRIVSQLQSLDAVDAGAFTKLNSDKDIKNLIKAGVGRSVYRRFSYGSGTDTVNTVNQVGNQSGNYRKIGDELSLRELARENMKILDVEVVVPSHINSSGSFYDIDQIYDVFIEDDDVSEPMYVYSVGYELTKDAGMLTRLRLCRLNTIVAYTYAIGSVR